MDILALFMTVKYPLIFAGALFEGPVLMTAAGFFYKLGYIPLISVYCTLLLGDLAGDVVWYYIGYHGAHRFIKRFGKFFGVTEESVEKLKFLFKKHDSKIIFINKITMGFGFTLATLMAAGMSKVSLKKFIWLNFLGGLLWTGFLMMLGYVFGNIYMQISESLRVGSIVAYLVVFMLALNGFARYMRRQILKNNKE